MKKRFTEEQIIKILKEHEAAKWLTKETLYSVDWLPADQALIGKIEKYLEEHA